jgi:hypothetical protein
MDLELSRQLRNPFDDTAFGSMAFIEERRDNG